MGSDSSDQYIHMVQHLIEECILFKMSREECMEALSKYANIKPVITSTVWKELEKENMEFFDAYYSSQQGDETEASEVQATRRIHEIVLDSSEKK